MKLAAARTQRVLVVEDSPHAAHLHSVLENAGLDVVMAVDGEGAVKLAERAGVALVISDITVAGMSGYDLCRRLKASPATRSASVVLLCALCEPMDIVRALACGADGFLPKPYPPDQIVARVRTILHNRKLRDKAGVDGDISFLGKRVTITSEKEQLLDFLMSTFEDTVWANRELKRREVALASSLHMSERESLTELARTNAELKQRLAERTIERDDVARDEAITELARTNAELKHRLAERTIERDDVARDEAITELARTNAELKQRLAERTIERDDVARDEAITELARTNAELKQRLAERTIERDDVARDEAITELARTNAELKQRLAERTIERDDVARDEALTELARTNVVEEYARTLEGRVQISEEKFRGFLSASPDAMLVVDEVGNVVLASERVEPLLGYSPGEIVGMPFELLMPARSRAAHAGNMRDFLRTLRLRDSGSELYALRKDGSEVLTEISFSQHQTSESQVVIAAIRDITVRKQTEAALQQAQKMEAVGQLISGAAHDFNNVLGAVIGNLDLLSELVADDSKAAHYAEHSVAAALSGVELVKRLLALSRRQPLRPESIDLRETIASVTPLIRRTMSEQITIVESLGVELWLALADPSQIENAVLNLAINARDAMPEGGTLTIDCRNTTVDEDFAPTYGADFQPGDYVVIAVTDTGHGMTADIAAKAFDPFFTTKGHGVGTGLGLSMVHGTMKQSGGTARIYSKPGAGTTVSLYLPRTTEPLKRRSGRAVGADAPSRGNERVLVVEDNERIRDVSYAMLTGLGYRVEVVESADAALARIVDGDQFDLVFSDVVMPGTHTGITLARELRKIDPTLKIVLTSGYMSPGKSQDGLGQLRIELIPKPFRKVELGALIRRVLDERPS